MAQGFPNQQRKFIFIGVGILALAICGGGAFVLLHHHEHAAKHEATTGLSPTSHPATTRGVKHKKKKH